ncbi:CUE domain-containing protein 1 [Toxorhynchites rutilus septentrionalis]|uniref:CUE domain-containing protein 1 n=1 Tax=Toxorhynchites rutilus septentrionalis TaxID=329112 RepID=UPI002479AE30|nr:CUE domain-containing protein 1 [Toxorhynchites rutilus septentrionalis]XP_055622298.1 CUE domain-containing protein 1 [Toxorhynchites rutilus septentrionalis]XP_055622299.1 CUE domain-containing protein 1 [Toxorhynchites rutilus septentrionalis]
MASTMQLEFAQAMSDFKNMFPEMDRDVIEAVLRANQGAVDATIDQLLAMSTDNQNEKLRQELDGDTGRTPPTGGNNPNASPAVLLNLSSAATPVLLSTSPKQQALGASPKIKKSPGSASVNSSPRVVAVGAVGARDPDKVGYSRWNPPMLGPLPPTFLRLAGCGESTRNTEFDLGDEQFAMMLQNEEFMAELRWNQEFLSALEKDHQGKVSDDAAFKERLRHMGKISRKKFAQLARVFTWQRGGNKKASAVRHPDSLLLQEEHSDDDEPRKAAKK